MTEPTADWLTVQQAISQSGFSRSQIYRWLGSGTVHAKKLGKSTYVSAASLRQTITNLPDYKGAEA